MTSPPLTVRDVSGDAAAYAADNPIVFEALPVCQQDSVLLGSGLVGVMIWQSAPDRLQFVMSRSDVYSRNRDVFQHRKPIGHCVLRFASAIRGGAARLDIFRAEAVLELEFADAPLQLMVICHALDDTLIVETDRDLQQAEWRFLPVRNPQSSRTRDSRPADNGPFESAEIDEFRSANGVQIVMTRYRERGLSAGELGLALQQPVEHGQHLVAGDGAEPEHGAEAGRGGLRRQRPGGGELGGGIDDARDNGGDGEIPHAVGLAVEDADQPQRPERSQHRRHMAVGAGPADGDGRIQGREHHPAIDDGADGVEEDGGHFREIGEGSPSDAFSFSPGLAQEDGRWRGSIGDDIDAEGQVPDPYMATRIRDNTGMHKRGSTLYLRIYMATEIPRKPRVFFDKVESFQRLARR
ncbi:MAG: hypothetical protein OXI81_10430 [Paracoccaceae bacterium]|nr:hypothetical protein [Paracoccaceae bacterium]